MAVVFRNARRFARNAPVKIATGDEAGVADVVNSLEVLPAR
jgi:hypothetical protein